MQFERKEKLAKNKIIAEVRSESFDAEKMTVEVIFTTQTPVRRRFLFGDTFLEVLGMNPDEVRLDRLNMGAPVLNNHRNMELSDQIGVVERAWVDGEKGYAEIRFSNRESVREIVEDIRDGIYKNISVGYVVHEFEEQTMPATERGDDEERTFRAVDWEPMEISVVSIPADREAQIRKEENESEKKQYEVLIRGEIMSDKNKVEEKEIETKSQELEVETPVEENEETEIETKAQPELEQEAEKVAQEVELETKSEEEITKAERARISEIQTLCKKFDIEEKDINNFIDNDCKLDDVRQFIIEKMAKEDQMKGTRNMNEGKIEVGQTDLEKKKAGLENAMLSKADIVGQDGKRLFNLDDNGKRFNNMSLIEMAKEVLETKGYETRNLPKHEVATRALHSTSDFKEILANVLNKSLRAGYEASPQTFSAFTRMIEVDDLKEISRTQFGEGGLLGKVKEGEEYAHDTISEAAEKYRVEKYGKIVNVTEETLINDDLGAFTRVPAIFGQRARDLESDIAWGVITSNAAMADGNNLFSASHGNLIASAGVLGETSLSTGRSLFRKQVGLDGMKLNLSPVFLAVPPELEVSGEKLLSSIVPDSTSSFNPFGPTGRTPLSLIVEPRLGDASAVEWYLFGALGQIDMVEMAMLRGMNGPMITQENGFDVDGLRVKIKHYVGAKALDWRGMVKSDGVA